MSNEEKRQTPPEGFYPGYNPTAQTGYGYAQNPYLYPQAPAGGQMGVPATPYPQASPYPSPAPVSNVPGMLPVEESYVENILRLNRGKLATVYMTFENNDRWNAKVFKGIIEAAGRDHLILSDPESNKRYLLLMIYLDYVTFDEELNYEYPYAAATQNLATYPPR